MAQAPIQRALLMSSRAYGLAATGRLEEARAVLPEVGDYAVNEDEARIFIDWDQARRNLEKKCDRLLRGGVLGQYAAQVGHLARISDWKGEEERAREQYDRVLKVCEQIGDVGNTLVPHTGLGVLEARQQNLAAAETHLRALREVVEGPEDMGGVVGLYQRLVGAVAALRGETRRPARPSSVRSRS